MSSLLRTNKDIAQIYERNARTVYRVCFLYMKKHTQDLEDAVSQTFLKLLLYDKPFENAEHEKAWLIAAATNVCRNMISSAWKRKVRVDSEYSPPAPCRLI